MNYTPRFTPGGDALYFSSNNDREFTAVARHDLTDGTTRWVLTDDDFDLTGWLSPDGTTLLVECSDDGASRLAVHDVSGALVRDLPLPWPGSIRLMTAPVWAPDSASVTITWSGFDTPCDVVVVPAGSDGPATAEQAARLRTRSARGLGGDRAVAPELHRVPAPDGAAISCQVFRPAPEANPDVAGSAVLLIHGGPEGQARQDFNTNVQVLAAAGHTVLVPNVRGSTGYGKRWYSADDKRLRLDSVGDLAALHAFLPELGLDQSRAALWGGSYGGYMVLAGLAFQPALWAAGVDMVGIASLVTFLENTSAYRRAYREREYGTLAEDREFLHSVSPLTRVDDITAPLFIIHGANDPRVPLSEAEQIHAALTSRGAECELLVYGDEGHGLARRANRLDAVPRALAFLGRHLGQTRAASAPAPGA
jgi:dipeptidyl aminopeptidase/acylaminoacyl peptidase